MILNKLDRTALKVTDLKYNYIQSISRLEKVVQSFQADFYYCNGDFKPVISYLTKNVIYEKLQNIRAQIVDMILSELRNFTSYTPYVNKDLQKELKDFL